MQDVTKKSISAMQDSFMALTKANHEISQEILNNVKTISDALIKELDNDEIDKDDRRYIIDNLLKIAELYNQLDERNKSLFDKAYNKFIFGVLGALLLVIGFAGYKIFFGNNKD